MWQSRLRPQQTGKKLYGSFLFSAGVRISVLSFPCSKPIFVLFQFCCMFVHVFEVLRGFFCVPSFWRRPRMTSDSSVPGLSGVRCLARLNLRFLRCCVRESTSGSLVSGASRRIIFLRRGRCPVVLSFFVAVVLVRALCAGVFFWRSDVLRMRKALCARSVKAHPLFGQQLCVLTRRLKILHACAQPHLQLCTYFCHVVPLSAQHVDIEFTNLDRRLRSGREKLL